MQTMIGRLIFAVPFLAVLACGQEVKIVEIEPTTMEFTKTTQSRKIEVKAKDIQDAVVPNIMFSFSSENPSVATVDTGGVVKPAGNGSTAIVARTPNGITGESFVKVCLPEELVCEPGDILNLKVGLAAPIKCHVNDCKGELIRGAKIEYMPMDKTIVLTEGDNIFIGLKIGDTEVAVKSFELEHKVKIHVDEQTYLPGMEPGSGGGGGKGGGGGNKNNDPYGKGRFDHILDNMNFKD